MKVYVFFKPKQEQVQKLLHALEESNLYPVIWLLHSFLKLSELQISVADSLVITQNSIKHEFVNLAAIFFKKLTI